MQVPLRRARISCILEADEHVRASIRVCVCVCEGGPDQSLDAQHSHPSCRLQCRRRGSAPLLVQVRHHG